jgi:hypothetical protein
MELLQYYRQTEGSEGIPNRAIHIVTMAIISARKVNN